MTELEDILTVQEFNVYQTIENTSEELSAIKKRNRLETGIVTLSVISTGIIGSAAVAYLIEGKGGFFTYFLTVGTFVVAANTSYMIDANRKTRKIMTDLGQRLNRYKSSQHYQTMKAKLAGSNT